jgi:hypothetical protein
MKHRDNASNAKTEDPPFQTANASAALSRLTDRMPVSIHFLPILAQGMETQERCGRRHVEMKLVDSEVLVQPLVSGMQEIYQPLTVSLCKSFSNVRVHGHQMGETHGHIGLKVNLVQKVLVQISQAFFLIDMNQTLLETVRNHKQRRGSHEGKEEKWNEKLPLETNIVQAA